MIAVSTAFKNKAVADARQYLAFVESGTDKIEEDDDLVSVKIMANGDMGRAVIRKAEFSYTGNYSFLGKSVNIQIGLVLTYNADGTPATWEYIDYGDFKVDEVEVDPETGVTKATAYDAMIDALEAYEPVALVYPATLKQFVEAVCAKFGWTLTTATFTNHDLTFTEELFPFETYTYRQALERVAEVAGAVLFFNAEGLVVKNVSEAVLETIPLGSLTKLSVENEWGTLNSVASAYPPFGEMLFDGGYFTDPIQDEAGEAILDEAGEEIGEELRQVIDNLKQYLFNNNPIATQGAMEGLFDALEGYEYYPFRINTVGLGWFELGDRVIIQDSTPTDYETNIMNVEIELAESGYREVIYTEVWENSNTAQTQETRTIANKVEGVAINGDSLQDDSVNAVKIRSISADKIITGTLGVQTAIYVQDENGDDRILIGYQEGGF